MSSRTRAQYGFTLLEVLIALAVIAIAMGALISAGSNHAGNAAYMRDRTLSQWVAMNELARLEIAGEWPGVGTDKGESTMAGREYEWTATVSQTEVENLRRIEIDVAARGLEDEPISSIVGFIRNPEAGE